jgi:hypothetical protein
MRVGQALKSKSGVTYLKFDKTVTIEEGETLFLSRPQDDVDYLVENGKITTEEGEARKAKIPDFVIYNIKVRGEKAATKNNQGF